MTENYQDGARMMVPHVQSTGEQVIEPGGALGLAPMANVPRMSAEEIAELNLAVRMGRSLARRGMGFVEPQDMSARGKAAARRAYDGEIAMQGNDTQCRIAYELGRVHKGRGEKPDLDWPEVEGITWDDSTRAAYLKGYEDEPRPSKTNDPQSSTRRFSEEIKRRPPTLEEIASGEAITQAPPELPPELQERIKTKTRPHDPANYIDNVETAKAFIRELQQEREYAKYRGAALTLAVQACEKIEIGVLDDDGFGRAVASVMTVASEFHKFIIGDTVEVEVGEEDAERSPDAGQGPGQAVDNELASGPAADGRPSGDPLPVAGAGPTGQ